MKRIILLKAWGEHVIGTILKNVDEDTVAELIEKGFAEIHDPVADGETKALAKKDAEDLEAKIAANVMEKMTKDAKDGKGIGAIIKVHDNSDGDPLGGFGPEGHSWSLDEVTEKHAPAVQMAFGKFCADVYKCRDHGASKTLLKMQERAEAEVKAAGTGMVVGDDEFGGYMTFSAATQMINQASLDAAIVRPRAMRMTLGTQVLNLPYLRDENHTSNVYGGVTAYWRDELQQKTASRPKMGNVEMKLKPLTMLGYVSEEWMKWSTVSLGSWLLPRFSEGLGWFEDRAFINGVGASQPLGVLNSLGIIEVAKESGQLANTLVRENIDKMFARLRKRNLSNVVWLTNDMCFTQLPQLNVTVGTGGSAIFTNNIGGAPGQSLWGIPIVYSEFAAALGDAKDMSLVNFGDYIIADDQSGPQLAQSIHLKFDYDQVAFRLVKYLDGQSYTQNTFQPHAAGTTTPDTLSPVVTIAERA